MCFKLFRIFFKIGMFTLGGGYAMLPLIEKEIVEKEGMITSEEYYDIIAIASSLPGAVAINCSIFVGYKLKKFSGAVAAALGAILPAFLAIVIVASFFYKISDTTVVKAIFKGIRPCIVPIIFIAVIKLLPMSFVDAGSFIIATIVASLYYLKKISPIYLIILGGGLGYLYYGVLFA